MNIPNDSPASPFEPNGVPPRIPSPTRPLYWSLRRELWENRSITMAPLIVAAVVLFASFIGTIGLPRRVRNVPAADAVKLQAVILRPYCTAPAPIVLATLLVGVFYALDALHGERRDRGILFWKSLPVSDTTTVLAKALIPLAVLPLIGFALGVVTQAVVLLLSTAILLAHGLSAAPLWENLQFIQMPLVLLYGLTAHVLWFAPIYGWLLLVSAWARRAPVLWALVPLVPAGFERIAFHTSYLGSQLRYRFAGAMQEGFTVLPGKAPQFLLTTATPLRFLSSPGLWFGLALAAAFIAMAVRLRRTREPI